MAIPLSARELQVADLVMRGYTNKGISAALLVTPETVRNHLSSIIRKLHVRNRTEIGVWMAREQYRQGEGH